MSTSPAYTTAAAQPWPEADALFRSDPRWLGSDDAYSIPLDDRRTLWLFGDTFVQPRGRGSRRNAAFINNSVGIQAGRDPSRASIEFAWGGGGDHVVSSFTSPVARTWLWPLHGCRLGEPLLLFFMVVRATKREHDPLVLWQTEGPLSFFEVVGWTAQIVRNPDDHPSAWRVEQALHDGSGPWVILGAGVQVGDGWLLAYGWDREKRISLARWPVMSAASGDLRAPEWFTAQGWRRDADPAIVIERGATEFTVHRDASGLYHQVQMHKLIGAHIARRTADAPEGPWSEPQPVFAPEEAARADALVYAGKAHPHLEGGELVFTYASNGAVEVTLDDQSIYYPRFARIVTPEAP